MGDFREPNVGAGEPSPPSSSNPSPWSIGAEQWARAEAASQKIISQIQPTVVSEERRRKVIDYVQRLIRVRLGWEVFPFGSVPLKTYLPDGDIDLTAFGCANVEDSLVNDVVSVLEAEDQNNAAEFIVKDVQLIWAEVKLVKCIVQSIVVDISFNQLGGICTLCFLEQVDRLIGKDHLFKRSIILIKAWCYYESRILGAHHGLISTYALETLVLYIFHLFHSKLNGPLAVLYRFLDYFSKFDWDNYCISLIGPVRVSSLPEIVAEEPENDGNDLLLSSNFLRYCAEMFSVPSRGADTNSRTFPLKHLNIIDPLKENNNLGRSVSKGNFYRIRSAFTYGARQLGRILLQPEDIIAGELCKFFSNTLDRHGSGQRPDVQDPTPMFDHNGFVPELLFSETSSKEEKASSELNSANSVHVNGVCKLDPDGSSLNRGNNVKILGEEMKIGSTMNGCQKGSTIAVNSTLSENRGSVNGTTVVGHLVSGDAEGLATSGIQGLKISNDTPEDFCPSGKESISQHGTARFAPHLYFSGSVSGNGKLEYGNLDMKELEPPALTADDNIKVGNHEGLVMVGSKEVSLSNPPACSTAGVNPSQREKTSAGAAGSPEYLNSLSGLSGDYESHLNSLKYGRWCHESMSALSMPLVLPSQFQNKSSWDVIRYSYPFQRNGFPNLNANGVISRPAFYRMNTPLVTGATFGVEEMPKPRGTGTYIPNTNRYGGRKPSTGRVMNQGPMRSPRNNGRAAAATATTEANFLESSRGPSQAQFSYQANVKTGSPHFYQSDSPGGTVHPDVNGLHLQSDGVIGFGSVGHVPLGVPLPESSRQLNPALLTQIPSQNIPTPGTQMSKPVPGLNQDRGLIKSSSYRLKDEDDFPPLPT